MQDIPFMMNSTFIRAVTGRANYAGGPVQMDRTGSKESWDIYGYDDGGYFKRSADCESELRAIVTVLNADPTVQIEVIEKVTTIAEVVNIRAITTTGTGG